MVDVGQISRLTDCAGWCTGHARLFVAGRTPRDLKEASARPLGLPFLSWRALPPAMLFKRSLPLRFI